MRRVHLKDITDVEILQEIQDNFAKATGLAAVTVDYKGKPITQYSNFSKFCRLIRENGICREACHQSDAHGGLEAARKERPYIYRCHTGLVDFAIPIIINGQYMASIMAGQIKVEEDEYKRLDHLIREIPEWRDREELVQAYNEIPVIPYNTVVAAAQMMFIATNSIVEKDMTRLMQEELNLKNLKLMEEVKARAELEKALKDTEIKALQSQVNPHFLFNVLNTIGRLALIESAPKTQEIVYTLAEILRYVLKSIDKMVELREEIAHIERYFKIQSTRFGERLNYEIDIAESIMEIEIPAMILQSLVENAINHGLEPKAGNGHIKITGYSMEDEAVIEISDDGIGIPGKTLENLFDGTHNLELTGNSTGIGINNVNKRLSYHYGPMHQLEIKSRVGIGTTVKVRIPKKTSTRRVAHVKSTVG